jgi:hypothetical protein
MEDLEVSHDFEVLDSVGDYVLVKANYPHSGFYLAAIKGDNAFLKQELSLLTAKFNSKGGPGERAESGEATAKTTEKGSNKSTNNKLLAKALRDLGKSCNGETWERAKSLIKGGASISEAAERA